MNDFDPLHRVGSAEQRATLQAARELRPSAASQQRALAALGLASATLLAPASASALLKAVKAIGAVALRVGPLKLGVGIAVASVAVGVAVVSVTEEPATPTPSARVAMTLGPPKRVVAPAEAPSAVQAAPAEAEAPPAEQAAPAAAMAPSPRARSAQPSAPRSEVASMDLARSRLAAGNAQGALATLDEQLRGYPNGSLASEARVLRIEALGQLGRRTQALAEANAFLNQNPNGILSHRVRRFRERQVAP